MQSVFDKKLIQFFSGYHVMKYKKKDTVIRVEDKPQGMYFISHGFVRMYILTGDGNEFTLNIFKPGSLFPLTWGLANIPNTYFYECMTEAKISRSPLSDFQAFLEQHTDVVKGINTILLHSLNSSMIRSQYLVLGRASHRVANVLLLLGRRFGIKLKDGSIQILFPITHQDIAHLCGLTRESIGAELQKLEKGGYIIRVKRRCTIVDPEKLRNRSLIYVAGNPLPYTY